MDINAKITDVRVGMRPWDIDNAEKIQRYRNLESKAAALGEALALTAWIDEQRLAGAEVLLRDPDGTVTLVQFPAPPTVM